jgi:molybdopterin molybdotransferase
MISIDQALSLVQKHTFPTHRITTKSLSEAMGYVLAENIVSPISMPPFRQSAMDGYALNLHPDHVYSRIGEVKAGDETELVLKKGEAVRIFTGARVPQTANAVVMQERVVVSAGTISVSSEVFPNENIRPTGEQVMIGDVALPKGTKLNAASIGFMASLGIERLKVFEKPSIAIVVTGNELVAPGNPLPQGKIYESNGVMLKVQLQQLGYDAVNIVKIIDDYMDTVQTLQEIISQNDVVMISGGISVGDYDFVAAALQELQVKELFYKVHQKPGKPLYFGKKHDTLIFALPGNPAATLSCFYLYVLLALEMSSGNKAFQLTRIKARATSKFANKAGRPQFLKAIYHEGKVAILEGQNSSMLQTFALANALVFVPETTENIAVDDHVDVILLP